MAEVKLKDTGPASYTAGGHRFLPGKWLEVEESLARRLKGETNTKGKAIFDVKGLNKKPEGDEGTKEPEGTQNNEEGSEGDETPLEETKRFKELDEENTVPELKEMADKFDLDYNARITKPDLIEMIMEAEIKMIEEGKEEPEE